MTYNSSVGPQTRSPSALGGCFTAHNVARRGGGAAAFLDYVKQLPGYETTIEGSSEGVSISYKRRR